MDPLIGLALGRIGVGVAALARPDLLAALPNPDGTRPNKLVTQAFGTREIALGAITLTVARSHRRAAALVGMFVDSTDAATAIGSVRSGSTPAVPGYALAGVAAGAVLAGAGALIGRRTAVEA